MLDSSNLQQQAATPETGTGEIGDTTPIMGQAGEAVVVTRPAPGQTVEIQAVPGQTYVLSFAPGEAQVQVQGENFILSFDDNGDGTPDSQVVFLDLVTVAESGEAPAFQMGGVDIDAGVLLNQALALAGQDETPLDDLAAGPGAQGGGATLYSDDVGDTIGLLNAEEVIPPTELQFGIIDLEDEITLLDEEGASADQNPALTPVLVVGENVSDEQGQSTPHRIDDTSDEPVEGPIQGNDSGDVLIGDVGGGDLVGKTLNLALVLDTSNSMEDSIAFGDSTTSRIEALDRAVEQLLQTLANTPGATVRVHMVSFSSGLRETATFDIINNGLVNPDALQDAKDFVLAEGDSPNQVANGNTNYEAGFTAARDWFIDNDNTLDEPDFNQTIFISDGVPNRVHPGNSSSGSQWPGSNQAAIDHVLGQATGDNVSEFNDLLGSFEGVNGTVDAIGINVDDDAVDLLDQVDGDDADNISSGDELVDALGNIIAQVNNFDAVGNDVIVGNGGTDLIFGDTVFTDDLKPLLSDGHPGESLAPASGWSVIEALIDDGFFDAFPGGTVNQKIMAFLRDPANQETYNLGGESLTAGGVGREGGHDSIDGGAGSDSIFGQEGNDTILGGTGDDVIIGGFGDDSMTGSDGADVFQWSGTTTDGEADVITDFSDGPGGDVLDLSRLLTGVPGGATAADIDAFLDFSFVGGSTTIAVDFDGAGAGADTSTITLQGIDLSGSTEQAIIQSLMDNGSLVV